MPETFTPFDPAEGPQPHWMLVPSETHPGMWDLMAVWYRPKPQRWIKMPLSFEVLNESPIDVLSWLVEDIEREHEELNRQDAWPSPDE